MRLASTVLGSPPHTRGKEMAAIREAARNRITPAYAGKSSRAHPVGLHPGDHPRIRGEKYQNAYEPLKRQGSPPHTRGKAGWIYLRRLCNRITPAYAGKRPSCRCQIHCNQDHPRIRGEKYEVQFLQDNTVGSPPHTRGKGMEALTYRSSTRITPAYAGKSNQTGLYGFYHWDHPRIRGEKPFRVQVVDFVVGSPPHTRGKVRNVPI